MYLIFLIGKVVCLSLYMLLELLLTNDAESLRNITENTCFEPKLTKSVGFERKASQCCLNFQLRSRPNLFR